MLRKRNIYTIRRKAAAVAATLVAMSAAATLTGCVNEEPAEEGLRVPITIRVSMEGETRAETGMGDPGELEFDQLPNVAYIWVCTKRKKTPESAEEEYVYNVKANLKKDNWKQDETYPNIYKYEATDDDLFILMPETTVSGSVYAAVAIMPEGEEWTLSVPEGEEWTLSETKCATEDDVKALTFDISGITDKSGFLKNLYSSPAEKEYEDTYRVESLRGEYYGTLDSEKITEPVVPIDLTLYHVAAKFDLTWNIASPDLLSQLTITELYQKDCSLFYPTNNSEVNTDATYDETIETDTGNQWLGRKSVYIIQKKDRTTFNFSLLLNDVDGAAIGEYKTDYGKKRTITGTGTLSEIPAGYYTQWFRGTIEFPGTTGSGTE